MDKNSTFSRYISGIMVQVVAVELGAKRSIIAFSSRHQPGFAWGVLWTGLHRTVDVPSSVLLTPAKEFAAFGYEAENKYLELTSKDEGSDWWMFRDLTALHNIEVIAK